MKTELSADVNPSSRSYLRKISDRLKELSFEPRQAEMESRWILSHLLSCEPGELYFKEGSLTAPQQNRLDQILEGRSQRIPLQYLLGEICFRDSCLEVTPDVLIPRPETEQLVDEVVRLIPLGSEKARKGLKILDLGTGSGCLAISLTKIYEKCRMLASDLSSAALTVARRNIQREGLGFQITCLLGDLFEPLRREGIFGLDLIVSNPPYLTTREWKQVMPEVSYEPRLALDGGEDGLQILRRLILEAQDFLSPEGWLVMEIGERQGSDLIQLAESSSIWREVQVVLDLCGRERFFIAQKRALKSLN